MNISQAELTVRQEGPIAHLAFNRPAKRNAVNDAVIESLDAFFSDIPAGVKVVVDPFSLQYLSGAQIDFIDSLMGGGFTVVNPNAVKSCACGQSFDTTFGGGAAKPCH